MLNKKGKQSAVWEGAEGMLLEELPDQIWLTET